MKKVIPEKKIVICDFCKEEMFNNPKTGDQWGGARWVIREKVFLGLFGFRKRILDVCPKCYKQLTGRDYTEAAGEED